MTITFEPEPQRLVARFNDPEILDPDDDDDDDDDDESGDDIDPEFQD